jgi:hypothetical protein
MNWVETSKLLNLVGGHLIFPLRCSIEIQISEDPNSWHFELMTRHVEQAQVFDFDLCLIPGIVDHGVKRGSGGRDVSLERSTWSSPRCSQPSRTHTTSPLWDCSLALDCAGARIQAVKRLGWSCKNNTGHVYFSFFPSLPLFHLFSLIYFNWKIRLPQCNKEGQTAYPRFKSQEESCKFRKGRKIYNWTPN